MIDQMLATDQAKNAEEYFKAYRGEINPELYDEVTNKVGNAVAYVDGKEFGDRDHSTILHSLDKVESTMRSDPAFAEKVKEITTNINSKK